MANPVAPPKPAVIRVDPLAGRGGWGEVLRVVPAFVISAGIHAGLFFLFFLVLGGDATAKTEPKVPTETVNTKIDSPQDKPEPFLTNPDEGIDPEVPTNYDVNRIEDVSVPGPVDPNAAVGIAGAPEGPPVTIPPPPGSGRGQGGAPDLPEAGGGAIGREIAGGFRGLRNVPGGFAGRSGATREKMANEGGGSPASEAAVARGLRWLALHQAPQGHWALDQYHLHARGNVNATNYTPNLAIAGKGQKNDTAGCAFGLLPFLAAGITHKPSGRTQDDQYVKTVKRALEWLINNQDKEGRFGGSSMYEHGLASIAICEAYGLTADPMLKATAQKALNFIVKAQHEAGGWRYQPRQAGDTSVVGWQVMALKSGQMSGLSVPNLTLQLAAKYLDDCESTDGGGYGYTGPGDSPTMSAVGLLCRQYLGTPRRNANLRNGVEKLLKRYPPRGNNIYYEYYATQVFHHMGGDFWDNWNEPKTADGKRDTTRKGMRDILIATQDRDGSWDSRGDGHAGPGGRIMKTSLTLLTLEVYYRHLPLYQRVDTKK